MARSMLESRLYLISRVVLGGVFIFASVGKIADPEGFARIVENYRLLPAALINPFALILPWVELIGGICLISGFLIKGSVTVVNLMMVVFMIAISANMIRGVDITCGCFSTRMAASAQAYKYLIRDIILLAMGAWIYYRRIVQEKLLALSRI